MKAAKIFAETCQYQDIVICLDYLSHIAILMFISTPLCHVHQDYGTPYVIKLLRLLQIIIT